MQRYAFLAESEEGIYDVFDLGTYSTPSRIETINTACDSGHPITGRITTEFGAKSNIGSFWDGEDFIVDPLMQPYIPIEGSDIFSFLCENKIIAMCAPTKNSSMDSLYSAAFTVNVTLIKVDNDSDVRVGDTWNGAAFSRPE